MFEANLSVPILVAFIAVLATGYYVRRRRNTGSAAAVAAPPVSVNYHFTRQCNYKCGFCFHTAKTSYVLPLDEAKRGLKLLKEAGES